MHAAIEVELRHLAGCPHTEAARELLHECLTELQLDVAVEDKQGEYPSPTILVNGEDVMGAPESQAAACRLDLPTRQRLLLALRRR
jgi:glutaredoxin